MRTLRRGSGLVLGMLWLLMADLATAGDYVLVIGKGFEVCEAYLKNLNSFPAHPPMVCNRPLNPKLTEFSKPQWQPLEVWPNRHLLRQAIRNRPSNLSYTDEEFEKRDPYDKWEANLQERMKERVMTFGTADLDIDRDGEKETVLRFDTGFPCDPANESTFAHPGRGIEFYVLTSDGQNLDAWKSGNFNVLGGRHEIVLYKGRVFITGWAGNLGFQGGELWVASPAHIPGMDKQACKFTYQPATQRRHS